MTLTSSPFLGGRRERTRFAGFFLVNGVKPIGRTSNATRTGRSCSGWHVLRSQTLTYGRRGGRARGSGRNGSGGRRRSGQRSGGRSERQGCSGRRGDGRRDLGRRRGRNRRIRCRRNRIRNRKILINIEEMRAWSTRVTTVEVLNELVECSGDVGEGNPRIFGFW